MLHLNFALKLIEKKRIQQILKQKFFFSKMQKNFGYMDSNIYTKMNTKSKLEIIHFKF